MAKKAILLFFITFLSFFFLANTAYSFDQCTCPEGYVCPIPCNSNGGCDLDCIDSTTKEQTTGGSVTLQNPLGDDVKPDIADLIGKVIKAVLGVVGSLALVMFIYGGFLWMTSAGNRERVDKGKNTLLWAAIGLVVIFAAYALVAFVFTLVG